MTYSLEQFAVLGHRGAKGHAPENTLASFRSAIELGATMTELDIHLSRDRQLVVMHDPDVSRTTNGSGHIPDLTLPEIKKLDAGSWYGPRFAGEKVPTLPEVIETIKGRILLNIEVKTDGTNLYDGIIDLMIEAVFNADMQNSVVVSSFHRPYLIELREKAPGLRAALLYSKAFPEPWLEAEAKGWDLHPHHALVDERLIAEAHNRGVLVRAWNPNEIEVMRPLLALGVDGIGTDYPERLLSLGGKA